MPQRDLSPKGIRDLAEANETAVAAVSGGPSRAILTHTPGVASWGFGEVLTISIDGAAVATVTMVNFAGGGTARAGANAVNLDVGGGVGDDANLSIRELLFSMGLLFDAGDISAADLEAHAVAGPVAEFGDVGATTGGSIIFKCYSGTVTLATDLGGSTVVNQS